MFDIDQRANDFRRLQEDCDFSTGFDRAPLIAEAVKDFTEQAQFAPAGDGGPCSTAFSEMEKLGYVRLGQLLDVEQAGELAGYFEDRPCYNGHEFRHGDGIGRQVGGNANEHPLGSYPLSEIAGAPYLLELANDDDLLAAAENYLGCVPTLYSMNVWWSFPMQTDAVRMTQMFHRDFDDFKYFSVFVYLTDVAENFGPHQYVPGTHNPEALQTMLIEKLTPGTDPDVVARLPAFEHVAKLLSDGACFMEEEKITRLFGEYVDTICAGAGSGFAANPSGIHRAVHPAEGSRLMFWARYGLYPNLATTWEGLQPVPMAGLDRRIKVDPKSRYINRLLLEFSKS